MCPDVFYVVIGVIGILSKYFTIQKNADRMRLLRKCYTERTSKINEKVDKIL